MTAAPPTACGFVAIVGAPNAGKSTLINQLVGGKIAIVTPKAQTTRGRIRGICVEKNAQIIFVDTPGIFDATQDFEKSMVAGAWASAMDADAVLLLVDAERGMDANLQAIAETLRQAAKPLYVALNKIDVAPKERLFALATKLDALLACKKIFMISAKKRDGIGDILGILADDMPAGPWLYPKEQMTDISERLLASEITRERCFYKLKNELPYALTVETEAWEEKKDGSVKISQQIIVQRDGQKKIVLGKGGAMLKTIGEEARRELAYILERKVHLFLFVKVREDWKDSAEAYRHYGIDKA